MGKQGMSNSVVGETMNMQQLAAHRGKVFWSDIAIMRTPHRDRWHERAGRLVVGRKRVYDHIVMGGNLLYLAYMDCQHERPPYRWWVRMDWTYRRPIGRMQYSWPYPPYGMRNNLA